MSTVCTKNRAFLYQQARNWLVGQMRTGKLKYGSRLPGERTLAELLKISRGTARVALQGLEKEGFIERIPSRGAFVKPKGEVQQTKLALVFPEAEISREYLTYADWTSSWGRQHGLLSSCTKNNAYLSFLYCALEKYSGHARKYYLEQFYHRLTTEFDGTFFMSPQLPELKQLLIDGDFPFISFTGTELLPGEKGITYNRKEICTLAAKTLLAAGCRRIAMLMEGSVNAIWEVKYEAFREVLVGAGIPFSMSNVLQTTTNEEETYQILKAKYKRLNNFDAFICTTQIHSMALLRLAREMGRKVPDDFFIMGYGNTPEITRYPEGGKISYIQLPYTEMGMVAGDMLIKKISAGTEIPGITIVPAKLVCNGVAVSAENHQQIAALQREIVRQ